MSHVHENDKARAVGEQAARSRDLRDLSYGRGRGDWPDPVAEPAELTQDEPSLLGSQVPGHRWNGWCRLTGDEDYYAACSCGWRGTATGDISAMLRQVKGHLKAVRQSRGWGRSARAPGPDESGPGADRGEIAHLHERARELRATARGGQLRLSRSLSHSADLLLAGAGQADRLVAELERGQSARTPASARGAEIVQHKVERARELTRAIVAHTAALAVITKEIAGIYLKNGHEKAIDWIYGERLIQPADAKPSSGQVPDK